MDELRPGGSPLLQQANNTLRRAEQMPPGEYQNELRRLGRRLLALHCLGMRANVHIFDSRAAAMDALLSAERAGKYN